GGGGGGGNGSVEEAACVRVVALLFDLGRYDDAIDAAAAVTRPTPLYSPSSVAHWPPTADTSGHWAPTLPPGGPARWAAAVEREREKERERDRDRDRSAAGGAIDSSLPTHAPHAPPWLASFRVTPQQPLGTAGAAEALLVAAQCAWRVAGMTAIDAI